MCLLDFGVVRMIEEGGGGERREELGLGVAYKETMPLSCYVCYYVDKRGELWEALRLLGSLMHNGIIDFHVLMTQRRYR